MSRVLMPRVLMGGQGADIALQTIVAKGTPAFYLPDPNPALRMPSGLRRGYQDFANTPVTAATQTAALALDLSEGAAIGAEISTDVDFDSAGDWSIASGWSVSGGLATCDGTNSAQLTQGTSVVAGGLYQLDYEVTVWNSGNLRAVLGSFTDVIPSIVGVYTVYLIAPTSGAIGFRSASFDGSVTSLSVKRVAGNHFYQATSADEPTLNLTSGLYGYLGDGTSKGFDNALAPAASVTAIVAGRVASVNLAAFFGVEVGTSRFRLTAGSGGAGLNVAVGSSAPDVFTGLGDLRSAYGIGVLKATGSSYSVAWKPIGGSISRATGSFSGSIPTSPGMGVLYVDDDGTPDSFSDGLINRFLMQHSNYSDAEDEAIINQWDRQLAALAA